MKLSYLPNAITLSRMALTPVFILLLYDRRYSAALALFVVAGVSDGIDGFIARRFQLISRLGSLLDPLADKVLLVSAYIMLTVLGDVPFWLMIVVGFRDLLIVGGYLVYSQVMGAAQMRPSMASKINTFMQISLVIVVLADQAGLIAWPALERVLVYAVLVTTLVSGLHYIWVWGVLKDVEPARPGGHGE